MMSRGCLQQLTQTKIKRRQTLLIVFEMPLQCFRGQRINGFIAGAPLAEVDSFWQRRTHLNDLIQVRSRLAALAARRSRSRAESQAST